MADPFSLPPVNPRLLAEVAAASAVTQERFKLLADLALASPNSELRGAMLDFAMALQRSVALMVMVGNSQAKTGGND
jgi:hypothetical protein